MTPEPQRDLTRIILGLSVVGALTVAAFWIVRPFLAATIWAIMIVVTTWQPMSGCSRTCGTGARWRSR